MKKFNVSFLIALFLYTSGMMPLSITKSMIIIPSSVSYAGLSEEQKQDLIDVCIAEGVLLTKCYDDIQRMEDEIKAQEEIIGANEELLSENGVGSYDSIILMIGIATSLLGSIYALIVGGVRFPSNWISAAGALTVFIWYIIELSDYNSSINNYGEAKIDEIKNMEITDENMDDVQVEFLRSQKEILEQAIPLNQGFIDCFGFAKWASGVAAAVALIEALGCTFSFGWWCKIKKKNNKNFLDFLLPSFSHAQSLSSSEIKSQQSKAKEELHSSRFGLNFAAYKNVFFGVWGILAQHANVGTKVYGELTTKATSSGATKAIAYAKIAIYGVDAWGYADAQGQYEDARTEINNRISKIDELIIEIEGALDGSTSLNQSGGPKNSGSLNTGDNFANQISNTPSDELGSLGQGDCQNFNFKNGALSKNDGCKNPKNTFPKAPSPKASFLEGLGKTGLSTDPNEYLDEIEKAVSTSKGIDLKKFSKQAKLAKNLKKKLLQIVKDNNVDLTKAIKDPNKTKKPEKLYKALLNNALDREKLKASLSGKILEGLKNTEDIKKKEPVKLAKLSKRGVTDDKSVLPKMPKYSIGSLDEDESDSKAPTAEELDYNSLNEYKDSAADIIKKPGVSIWKVISVRYKKSAYDDLLKKKKNRR